MMIRDIMEALCAFAFLVCVLEGMAERDEKLLMGAFLIGGGGIWLSGASIGALVYVLLLGGYSWFLLRGDKFWTTGTGVFRGEEDGFCRPTCAYEIKVRYGERYIIVQLRGGKTYYYEGVDEFLCFWEVSEDFYEIRELLGLATSATCDKKCKEVKDKQKKLAKNVEVTDCNKAWRDLRGAFDEHEADVKCLEGYKNC